MRRAHRRPALIGRLSKRSLSQKFQGHETMPASKTLREITGLGHVPGTIGKSALILIDCQNTSEPCSDEPALQCSVAQRFANGVIQSSTRGADRLRLKPVGDRRRRQVASRRRFSRTTSSFEKTNLDDLLKGFGVRGHACGIMTHVCVTRRARCVQSRLSRHGRRQCDCDAIASQSGRRSRVGERFARRKLGGAS